jgi:predicted 2-oxoglutarate/Fe(II)-dependent dioxygenase YbiX
MQPTIVDSFISKELAKEIELFLRPKAEVNPKGKLSKQLYPFDVSNETYIQIKSIIEDIQRQFGFPEDKIKINRVLYQVLREGEFLGYHVDDGGGVDGYGAIGYSALLYLNNDYEGGEILFYHEEGGQTAYKPDPGALIYFKGDKQYPHSVNEVTGGERANIILFFNVNE